jgi:cation:H+ antiporter
VTVFWAIVLFALGIFFTIKGADYFVRAAGWLSNVTGISRGVMGATVIAFSTSAPELFVSLFATLKGYNDISMGNIVGSNICNLGIGFVIIACFLPCVMRDKLSFLNGFILLFATGIVAVFAFVGVISVWLAIVLMATFVFFVYIQIKYSGHEKAPRKKTNAREITWNLLLFAVGMVGIVWGSNIIVDNAKILGTKMGISDHIMGLTIVAVGTSLPEIFTTIVAVVKREHAMSVGNLIGSNIFNITFVLAIVAFVSGGAVAVSNNTMFIDMPVAMLFAAIAVIPTLITKRVYRAQGVALGLLYCAYIVTICVF